METIRAGKLLRRWLGLVVVGSLLGGGLAFALTPQPGLLYESSSTLIISQGSKVTPSINDVFIGQRLALSYAELIRTTALLDEVIASLDLSITPDELARQVSASNPNNTNLLIVTVRDSDLQRAADITNELVRVFIARMEGLQAERYADFKLQIENELEQAQNELQVLLLDGANSANEIELEQGRVRVQTLLVSYEAARLAEVEASDVIMVFEEAAPGRLAAGRSGKGLAAVQGTTAGAIVAIGIAALAGLRRRGVG